ncbi:MAG: antitoxin [Actinomycetota bacterium]|nr:antitoxin [Actinomycetota bacterium]
MATIQVRDLPEDVYEIIRKRARVAGQSIQAYMKDEITRLAHTATDAELFAEIEQHVEAHGVEIDRSALLGHLDADRR